MCTVHHHPNHLINVYFAVSVSEWHSVAICYQERDTMVYEKTHSSFHLIDADSVFVETVPCHDMVVMQLLSLMKIILRGFL